MMNAASISRADLHIHTLYSDGTDTAEKLLETVKAVGLDLFSITDHDTFKGCTRMMRILKSTDPCFIPGIEFSCKSADGRKYHILGYAFRMKGSEVEKLSELCHSLRIEKAHNRLDFLKNKFHFEFSPEETERLFSLDNPGKPHIGKMMVSHGYAQSISEAIDRYISEYHGGERTVTPEEAIFAINASGGIPVLAHGPFGDGDQLLDKKELVRRADMLTAAGLKGMECFYSGFSNGQESFMLELCKKYSLLSTAGSDYHGENKAISIGNVSKTPYANIAPYIRTFAKEAFARMDFC